MLVRVTLALAFAFAPIRASADGGTDNASALSRAREAAKIATRAKAGGGTPEEAALAAFEASNLWQEAYQADGDEMHLCAAFALLTRIRARHDLDPAHRASLDDNRKALGKINCPKRRSKRAPSTRTSPKNKLRREDRAQGRTIPISADLDATPFVVIDFRPRSQLVTDDRDDNSEPWRPTAPATLHDAPAASVVPTNPVSPRTSEQPSDSGLDPNPSPNRLHLRISGGISLGLGLVALGVMTPFALRDAALAMEISGIGSAKNPSNQLTTAEFERLDAAIIESRSTFRSSLALGLSGGVATVLGVGLLIASRRRASSSHSLALKPRINLSSASITLQGHF